jgi:hypothetical protein
MTSEIFEKYLSDAKSASLMEWGFSPELKKAIEANPVHKKIVAIMSKVGYHVGAIYIRGDINKDGWFSGGISSNNAFGEDPAIEFDSRVTNGKSPKLKISIPTVGPETLDDADKRIKRVQDIIKAVREIEKLDWTKLYVYND